MPVLQYLPRLPALGLSASVPGAILSAALLHTQNEERELRDGRNYEEMMKPSVRRGPGMERSAAPRANGRVYTDNDCVNRRLASSMF